MPLNPPSNYNSESDWMSYCVPIERDAGHPQDQAVAICEEYWRNRNKRKNSMPETPLNEPIHHQATFAVTGDDRRIRFVASDEKLNRYGQIVRINGWELDNYKKNPILLWQHQTDELPIGKVSIGVIGDQLVADAEFATEDLNPFAERVYQMAKAGYINAVSVGFMPLDGKPIFNSDGEYEGMEFTQQELLELSVVNIPANPSALQVAHHLKFSDQDINRLFAPKVVSDRVKHARRYLDVTKLRVSAPG